MQQMADDQPRQPLLFLEKWARLSIYVRRLHLSRLHLHGLQAVCQAAGHRQRSVLLCMYVYVSTYKTQGPNYDS